MKLVEFVAFLHPDSLQERFGISETEDYLIYMKDKIDIDADVYIFNIDETEDDLVFENEGTRYVQLFALDHVIDLLEELDLKKKGIPNLVIAEKLIDYRLNDA